MTAKINGGGAMRTAAVFSFPHMRSEAVYTLKRKSTTSPSFIT